MIYGIDASSANKEKRTGVEWYAYHLIQHMKDRALEEDERVLLYTNKELKDGLQALPDRWKEEVLDWSLTNGWMRGRMSWEMLRRSPNVLFVPAQGLPYFAPDNKQKKRATVTTIHDVGFKRFPGLYNKSTRRRLERATKRAVKNATHILTVSEFSKSELIRYYDVKEDRITVTYPAADTDVFKPMEQAQAERVCQKYRIGENFFLYVGRLDAKKNLSTLIRGFEMFKSRRGVGDPFSLILVGTAGNGFENIKKYAERSKYSESIKRLGADDYIPTKDVAALVNEATAFVFPSKYEGFGIPNVEAMACGTPLITSDIPPHREVVGASAGVFVSPSESESWTTAMERVIEERGLAEKLRDAGIKRAKQFSWDKTAEKTWNVLRNVVIK